MIRNLRVKSAKANSAWIRKSAILLTGPPSPTVLSGFPNPA